MSSTSTLEIPQSDSIYGKDLPMVCKVEITESQFFGFDL